MATLILKKSSVAGKVPLTTDLQQGELAVNTADKLLYTKDSGGTVVLLNGKEITVSTTAPSSPVVGQLWFDIS